MSSHVFVMWYKSHAKKMRQKHQHVALMFPTCWRFCHIFSIVFISNDKNVACQGQTYPVQLLEFVCNLMGQNTSFHNMHLNHALGEFWQCCLQSTFSDYCSAYKCSFQLYPIFFHFFLHSGICGVL